MPWPPAWTAVRPLLNLVTIAESPVAPGRGFGTGIAATSPGAGFSFAPKTLQPGMFASRLCHSPASGARGAPLSGVNSAVAPPFFMLSETKWLHSFGPYGSTWVGWARVRISSALPAIASRRARFAWLPSPEAG
jgi:hypothetical protein